MSLSHHNSACLRHYGRSVLRAGLGSRSDELAICVIAGLTLLCLALLAETAAQNLAPARQPYSEYDVKAAYLLNFTKFTDWPDEAFEQPDSPLSICIVGDDPFDGTLDKMIGGQSVNQHKLAVRRIRSAPGRRSCQVLFVGATEKSVSRILKEPGPGVLTVGELQGFLEDGGIINFVVVNRRVRFDVSLAAAESTRIKLSSKLLSVARSIQK